MTKKEMIAKIAQENNLTQKETQIVVDAVFATIKETIKEEKVSIAGFGNFETKINSARMGINPKTKEPLQINASTGVKFKVAKAFKEELN